jgi:CRP-like cAMP-binding protein
MAGLSEASDLDGIALLVSMSRARREALARRCAWRRFRPGEEILARDEPADAVLFIVEGRVRVVDFSVSGREVAYAVVGAGGHVGELGVIDGAPRSASVVAVDACRVACLPATAFWELLEAESSVAKALLQRLARIIRDNDEKITELATMGAMQRVYRELVRLSRPLADGVLVVENLPTQEILAGRLGTTRPDWNHRAPGPAADDPPARRPGSLGRPRRSLVTAASGGRLTMVASQMAAQTALDGGDARKPPARP